MEANARKKGLSPLLAAVLLIAFTVALATIIFGFLATTARTTTVTAGNRTTEAVDCSTASIKIEDVYAITAGNGTVYALVRNAGLADNLLIQDATFINASGANFSTSTSMPLRDFDKGELARLTFSGGVLANMLSAGCPSAFSKVIVSTSCAGISDTFDGTPKCAAS